MLKDLHEKVEKIILQKDFSEENLAFLIGLREPFNQMLQKYADIENRRFHGDTVHFRGLIEISNICIKNCYYCGIRNSNHNVERYILDDKDILDAVDFAFKYQFGSIVFQSGERSDDIFINKIDNLLQIIKKKTGGKLGITLSLGEQTEETYRRWFDSGAHRYLLRIEATNRELFENIHPFDSNHSFESRFECLNLLKKIGYQTGTGVMIGLPGQTMSDLADDIMFFKSLDVDMVGMGPYIEHKDTPLFEKLDLLWPINRRFEIALNMIAVLRIVMPDINIASATALQAIDPEGREKALQWGANIIMPNITPTENRKNYILYKNKPGIDESADDVVSGLLSRIKSVGKDVAFSEWGDSKHYYNRNKTTD